MAQSEAVALADIFDALSNTARLGFLWQCVDTQFPDVVCRELMYHLGPHPATHSRDCDGAHPSAPRIR